MIESILPRIGIKINWDLILNALPSLMLMVIIVKIIDEIEKPRPVSYFSAMPQAPKKRKDFSKSTKDDAKFRQGFLCNYCKQPTQFWEFHHIDGNRSNNWPSNCEGLCPLCHAKKTRKIR